MSAKPLSETIRATLKEMRDNSNIDFTNKNDYAPKLKQIASDNNCDYTTVYKQMKKIAKEKGINVGEHDKQTKNQKGEQGKASFSFSAKKSNVDQNKIAKQRAELEHKKKEFETQIEMQNMIAKSPAFEMVKTSNFFTLGMFRELIQGLGGQVADEKKYEAMAGMMAVKEIKSGFQIPSILETGLLIVGGIGLFLIPLLPQIKKWLNETGEEKEKKSEEPLSDDSSPELKNGKPEEKKDERETPKQN